MVCKTCQKNKKQNLNHGKLTTKEAEGIQWDRLSVYLIGLYKVIKNGNGKPLTIEALTIIDSATGWNEIIQ